MSFYNFRIVKRARAPLPFGRLRCGGRVSFGLFLRIGGDFLRTEYLLRQEIDRVLAALMPSNRLVMRVILHTGLRIGDVLQLRPEDLQPRRWVTEQKTGKRRLIGFPAPLIADLRAEANETWVFPSPRDPTKHRTRQTVWTDVKRAARLFRLPQNVGTHSARKCYAVELMRKYGDIAAVQRNLKHGYATTTMIYALADQLLMQKYKKRRKRY